MDTLEHAVKLLLLFVIWAVLSSPFLIGAFFVARMIRQRGANSYFVTISFALAVALLVAPVPTSIITVFIPNAFALFDHRTSVAVTSVIACTVALRYVGIGRKRGQ